MNIEKKAQILNEVAETLRFGSEAFGTEFGFESDDDLSRVTVVEFADDGSELARYTIRFLVEAA